MTGRIPRSLRPLVTTKFHQARNDGDVIFSETSLAVLRPNSRAQFQFRYLPSLSKKPVGNQAADDSKATDKQLIESTAEGDKSMNIVIADRAEFKDVKEIKKKIDPFDNPSSKLLVTPIPETNHTHNIVLNKFPIIPNHFILSTKDNKAQDHPLECDDLSLAYECVQIWPSLFAFFNSGPQSGASQPHRHIQFLPIEDMKSQNNQNQQDEWTLLTENMTSSMPRIEGHEFLYYPGLPCVHLALRLAPDSTPEALHSKYLHLLRASFALALDVARHGGGDNNKTLTRDEIDNTPITQNELREQQNQQQQQQQQQNSASTNKPEAEAEAEAEVGLKVGPLQSPTLQSYNLSLTKNLLVILPRRESDAPIHLPDAAASPEALQANGTLLAGTILTKSAKVYDHLCQNPDELLNAMACFGYPWPMPPPSSSLSTSTSNGDSVAIGATKESIPVEQKL